MSDSLRPQWLQTTRLSWQEYWSGLPCPPGAWDSPGKNTEVGCHTLLQGIFLTPGWNWRVSCFLHWQGGLSHYRHLGSPKGGLHLSKRFSISLIVLKNCWKFILQNHTFILNTMLNHRKQQKLNEKCKLSYKNENSYG